VPVIAAICAAEILGLAGFSIVPALLPQFIDVWSLTNTQAGWLAGIVSAGYMLAVIPLVGLTDRRSARQIYLASSVLSADGIDHLPRAGDLVIGEEPEGGIVERRAAQEPDLSIAV
jgi:hypothetical protein